MSQSLTTAELAERWGMNPGTLANWRMFKRGPTYQKRGSRVTYPLAEVEAFEAASLIEPKVVSKLRPKRKKKNGS